MQHLGAYFSHLFSFHMCKLVSYKGIMLWLSFTVSLNGLMRDCYHLV